MRGKYSYNESIKKISRVFYQYSIQDIVSSLFILSLWLPNISAQVQIQFLNNIFLHIKPKNFLKVDKISSYNDFKKLINKIWNYIQSFPTLEDYIPETDWGNIKYYYKDKMYKIFYGNELDNIYDRLSSFELINTPLDEKFKENINRSPLDEFVSVLNYQDTVINGITKQVEADKLSEFNAGNLEVPPDIFWNSTINFYSNFKLEEYFEEDFLKNYSTTLGRVHDDFLNQNKFVGNIFSGSLESFLFISYNKNYYPLSPRRSTAVMFGVWSELFKEYYNNIYNDKVLIKLNLVEKF